MRIGLSFWKAIMVHLIMFISNWDLHYKKIKYNNNINY